MRRLACHNPAMSKKTQPHGGGEFAAAVVRWQKKHGRNNLPWQKNPTPYTVWVSEIMLQQTQVAAAAPYYKKFIRRWPDVLALSRARAEAVLAAWSGLGYYARARNLLAAAKIIARGGIPQTAEGWEKLPGVGRSTAAAVAVFSFRERAAVLDGNIKRVLARAFLVQTPVNTSGAESELRALAESLLPGKKDVRAYTQGMMDLGATVCARRNPRCGACPLRLRCRARQTGAENVLPRRLPPKQKPEKTAAFALLCCGGLIFLEKRPPSGIWGGLWSMPESKTPAALKRLCENRLGAKLTPRGGGGFVHSFTHYKLHARVFAFSCPEASPAENGKWFSRRAVLSAGLPAPVKKYILDSDWGGD